MGGKSSTAKKAPDQPLSGILQKSLSGHKGPVISCSFSPDERHLASCGIDGKVIIWDVKSLKCLKQFEPHKSDINCLAFSPDSSMLLTCSKECKVSLWDVKSLRRLYSSRILSGSVTHCAFAKDTSKYFATCSEEGAIGLFEKQVENISKKVIQAHEGVANQICFSPDGIHVASCGNDRKIILWNRHTGKRTAKMKDKYSRVLTCQFNPLGTLIAAIVDGDKVRIWSSVNLEVVCVLEDHHIAPVTCCAFSCNVIATGSVDNTVALWDPSEPHPLPTFHMKAHDKSVQTLTFSSTDKYLATGGLDRKVNIWT